MAIFYVKVCIYFLESDTKSSESDKSKVDDETADMALSPKPVQKSMPAQKKGDVDTTSSDDDDRSKPSAAAENDTNGPKEEVLKAAASVTKDEQKPKPLDLSGLKKTSSSGSEGSSPAAGSSMDEKLDQIVRELDETDFGPAAAATTDSHGSGGRQRQSSKEKVGQTV